MKLQKYFRTVFLFSILTGLFSCSDDDPEVREAVVKVVIAYSGDYSEFEELLGVQVTSENISCARLIISICPLVTGSNVPGYKAIWHIITLSSEK